MISAVLIKLSKVILSLPEQLSKVILSLHPSLSSVILCCVATNRCHIVFTTSTAVVYYSHRVIDTILVMFV